MSVARGHACFLSARLALHGPEGVNDAGPDRAWPSPSLPSLPPPASIPFLWTSHPVFRFQRTYLSNLRGAEQQPALSALARSLPSGCPVVPEASPAPPPSPPWVLTGTSCRPAEPSPLQVAVYSKAGTQVPSSLLPPPLRVTGRALVPFLLQVLRAVLAGSCFSG